MQCAECRKTVFRSAWNVDRAIRNNLNFHCNRLCHAKYMARKGREVDSPEWRAWASMKKRCKSPTDKSYKNYGGRGIFVCKRWASSYSNFFSDMGRRPSDKHSLDRIDNDGPYSPKNCRWATAKQQSLNTRVNNFLVLNGQRLALTEWARKIGISRSGLRYRLKEWEISKALTTPSARPSERNAS